MGSIAALGLGVAALAQQAQPVQPQPLVDKFVLKDTIQPVSAGRTDPGDCPRQQRRRAGAAGGDGHAGRPAGFDARPWLGAILGSRVPVIVYVAPAGARAGSAGFFLLEAADVAAMAPGTECRRGASGA